jgi:hypothetical protein
VNAERAAWVTAVVVLLTIGLLIGRQFMDVPHGARVGQRSDPVSGAGAEGSFRQWFWKSRGLDLVAQVGLIFTGALGIAALLPQGADGRRPRGEDT